MGVWQKTPNVGIENLLARRNCPLCCIMVRSVIESGKLSCEPNDVAISYLMNRREKIHSTFIRNDKHVSLYMLNVVVDGSRPILRINIIARSPVPPLPHLAVDNDDLDDDECAGDHSMNMDDHAIDMKNHPMDEKFPE
ncbi:hypothetical protein BC332_27918 [Capsicum chinense]|nr:hypothetical protein BC332_27918 [Capsicum chinense]